MEALYADRRPSRSRVGPLRPGVRCGTRPRILPAGEEEALARSAHRGRGHSNKRSMPSRIAEQREMHEQAIDLRLALRRRSAVWQH